MAKPQFINRIPGSKKKRPGAYYLPPMVQKMLKNPAVVALSAAFGIVMIAAVVATIMGMAEEAREAYQKQHP